MSKFNKAKAVIATAALIAFGSSVMACSAPADGYTGTAVVKEHHRSGKYCRGTVTKQDGTESQIRFGRKTTCYDLKDGQTIKMVNGSYKR